MDVTSVAAAVLLSGSSIVLLPLGEERWPLHFCEVHKHCVTIVHLRVCKREWKGVGSGFPEVRDQVLFHPYFNEILKNNVWGCDLLHYMNKGKQNNSYSLRTA